MDFKKYILPYPRNMANSMALNSGASVWVPYKELYTLVHTAITRKQSDAIHDLEVALRRHKPNFINLLQSSAKDSAQRETVKKATTEGITIQGQQGTQTLSQQFIDEAIILSDLFNLNEYAAVELLMAGENQLPNFPGLTRGLVAVILYYDGRRNMVSCLRTLIQARTGRTWTLDLPTDLENLVMKFTDQIMEEGLTNKILSLITEMDITKEMDKLQRERALGNAKHKKQVTDLYKETQLLLAECLYCWAGQAPLPKQDTSQLLDHLKRDNRTNPDGTIDSVTMALLMALLYCIDVSVLDRENSEDVSSELPVFTDDTYVTTLHQDIMSDQAWENPGLKAVVQFAWAQTLRKLSQQTNGQAWSECCENDEYVVDMAVDNNVFFFLCDSVIGSANFHSEEFYLRRIHGLVTDFIIQMPLKVKELRNRGDETARIIMAHVLEGVEPPSGIKRDFEHLMRLIADLYVKDPLNLELALEYWCPPEPVQTGASFSSVYHYRPPQRQISLFKFVRLAGDLLPASLYIPYINMLTGLANGPQCAHHCFNLLKSNAMGGGHASTVSWDHFFLSLNQYYSSLRQEVVTSVETSHIPKPIPRNITQQELEGLIAVLQLTRQVADQDESSRVSLVENPQWLPVVIMFGLVGCAIPPTLKAELLLTLSAFGKTAEIAASLWQSLEVSQILPTHGQPGGLKVELDEVESRNEEFPMVRAFLDLLGTLTDIPVPAGLGAGYRAPGFEPYLEFVRDDVFHKFTTRAYRNAGEKWDVSAATLEVLYKLLKDHEVRADHFLDHHVEVQGGGTVPAAKPPGHSLLVHMLNDGAFLRMILYITDEANRLLGMYTPFPGKESLERTALLCLKMMESTLEKQSQFFDVLRDSGTSLIVSPLDKLLMGINPRSGVADHLVNVTKFVTYKNFLPEHSLSAVKILCWVCQSALVQPELVGMFTAQQSVSRDLLHGFVECLDSDDIEEKDEGQEEQDGDLSSSQIRNAIRQNILRLLVNALDQPAPNITHFLLGFDLRKQVAKSNLQDPGVLDSPRTCLHSVLDFLDKGVGSRQGPACVQEAPYLAVLAYQLIYCLCANRETSSPTMRYLRTSKDFLYRHVQHLPFKVDTQGQLGADMLVLGQLSWLLKSVALELKMTSANRQRSNTQRLLNLLLDDTPAVTGLRTDVGYDTDYSQYELDRSGLNTTEWGQNQTYVGSQTRRKILQILDVVDFSQLFPIPLQFEYFDPSVIEQVINSCEQKNDQGLMYCNVKMLHQILIAEVNNNLQGPAAAGQRPLVLQEVEAVLAHIVQRNAVRECLHSKRSAFEAWRQVVEVILTACPEDLLQGEARQTVLFELLQDLFLKISDEDAFQELTNPVAAVILTLLANLRHCFLSDQSDMAQLENLSHYVTMLDGSQAAPPVPQGGSTFTQQGGARTLFASSLQAVLKGLVEHILRTSSGSQRVRSNLYGALLYYLQIAQKPKPLATLETVTKQKGVGSSLASRDSEYEKLTKENLHTILSYGENFMEIICRDACDGHDVGRMLSLACIDAVVAIDRQQAWLSYMSSKGYVLHIVESMVENDEVLQSMLSPNPEPLRALYIYESKMGLLTRLAESATGAQTLLQCGIMSRLAECNFFDLRPEMEGPPRFHQEQSFIPSILMRYRQLLLPALKLCLAVMTSLGIENKKAANQVLQFVIAHADVFNTILRDKQSELNLAALEELSLTSAVISRAAAEGDLETDFIQGDTTFIEFRGHLSRIQRQLIALLPKYCLTESLQRQIRSLEPQAMEDGRDMKSEVQVHLQEIAANIVAFCRAIISKSGSAPPYIQVLFAPNLIEATARDTMEDLHTSVMSTSRPPNLGLIVYQLRQCANSFMSVWDTHKQYMRKLANVLDLGAEELKELSVGMSSERISTQQRQQLARKKLMQLLNYKAQELQHYSYTIENCLFILWRHLEYYLVHCVPADQGQTLFQLHAKKHAMRRLQENSVAGEDQVEDSSLDTSRHSGVSQEDLQHLRANAGACINETLFRKLQEIEQCYAKSRTRYGFIEALIRRLKRLLKLHTSSE
ncbi:nuclear pore complex protein Nup205 [Lingula anatina]|uniref:Nuclear pore complex protein Nup205 n=1 Tax=Lingula anatina TaxID=7574 RepID=A0A1S3HEV2_LINAN|nr:nuclear pore complex protein Nup205 [Lingula anatina]|eukprot:XP_013384593.1 nuclear pore complex protein Nup205 [Lingula anatina]